MLKRFGLLAVCLVMCINVASAQTETPDTFPVELLPISKPTAPPKGWTYPGMILMSGYAGIHAMQADWDAPRVVGRFTFDEQGNVPIDGGQISPDENWYAAPIGEVYHEETFNNFWIVRGLKIYNLSGDGKTITIDLTNYQDSLSGCCAWGFSPVTWQDDQSLTVGELLIRPFEQAITHSDTSTTDVFSQPRVASPDLSRRYESYSDNSGFGWGIYDLTNSTRLTDLGRLNHISWQHDSSGFMAQLQRDQIWHGLAYFGRDGNLIEHVLQFNSASNEVEHFVSGRSELQWSSDDRYFGFVLDVYPQPKKLMLVDTQERIVIDTGLNPLNAPVWSPDGTRFAYLANARENLNLIVVDTKTWKAYIVAQHSGHQAWLNYYPEMVGWRSTENNQ